MKLPEHNERELQYRLMEIYPVNGFNDRQGIIRVSEPGKDVWRDFRLAHSFFHPNPNQFMCVVLTDSYTLTKEGLSEDSLKLPPGWSNKNGTISSISAGLAYLVSKNQQISGADPQSGSAPLAMSNTNTFDSDKIKISISPALSKSYTNNSQNNTDHNKVGIFMNDDTVVIRSAGGAVTVGQEGVHIGGRIYLQSDKKSKDLVMDNPFHGLFGTTVVPPIYILALPELPNIGTIAQIANIGYKLITTAEKAGKIVNLIGG